MKRKSQSDYKQYLTPDDNQITLNGDINLEEDIIPCLKSPKMFNSTISKCGPDAVPSEHEQVVELENDTGEEELSIEKTQKGRSYVSHSAVALRSRRVMPPPPILKDVLEEQIDPFGRQRWKCADICRMKERTSKLKNCMLCLLPLGKCKSSFNLEKAVCNHGFFMMAPNKWIPSSKSLQRPLRLSDQSTSVIVTISHPLGDPNIHILVHDTKTLSLQNRQSIFGQVARMLRISEKDEEAVNEFQKVHPEAKKEGFGRIFRSPSLFEDAVKSILLCNCTWSRTLEMAKSLCELQLQLSAGPQGKRKGRKKNAVSTKDHQMGNFPNSKELANLKETHDLRNRCSSLGYRAGYIINLANGIEKGTFSLEKLEHECDYKRVHHKLNELKGFGLFTIASVLMCLGFYQMVPADTETTRHLKQVHGMSNCNNQRVKKDVKEIYQQYAPFQCIAYWFELLQGYEKSHGKLSELCELDYPRITGSIKKKQDSA